jgi:hypothetical protein
VAKPPLFCAVHEKNPWSVLQRGLFVLGYYIWRGEDLAEAKNGGWLMEDGGGVWRVES